MKVFMSGIAGTGMSALAGLFKESGHDVWGSDMFVYPPVDRLLDRLQVHLFDRYRAENISLDTDFCVIGNVISRGNPEAEFILNHNFEYYSMAEALYRFFIRGNESVVVAGTHGKTTISSFVAHLLQSAGKQPGYFIGGKPLNFESNYALAKDSYFVTEGDEYETSFFDRSSKFLKYHPRYLILTAMEYDHLDFFPSEALYLYSFQNLVNQVPSEGLIVVNSDSELAQKAVAKSFSPVVSYGESECDFCISRIDMKPEGMSFRVSYKMSHWDFFSPVAGRYNAWNITAGISLAVGLDIPLAEIRDAVSGFSGVERRLRVIGRKGNTVFFEDFAHHPTSIRHVLESLRQIYQNRKIVCFFEPRSWSLRRNYFQQQLAGSFLAADRIFFRDIYQKEQIPHTERLDLEAVCNELREKGRDVILAPDDESIRRYLNEVDCSQDQLVVIISNGRFADLAASVDTLCRT